MGAVSGQQDYERTWFERAATQATQMGYLTQYSDALMGLGENAKHLGQFIKAEEKYKEALSVLPASTRGRPAYVELNLCAVLMARGEYRECRERRGGPL